MGLRGPPLNCTLSTSYVSAEKVRRCKSSDHRLWFRRKAPVSAGCSANSTSSAAAAQRGGDFRLEHLSPPPPAQLLGEEDLRHKIRTTRTSFSRLDLSAHIARLVPVFALRRRRPQTPDRLRARRSFGVPSRALLTYLGHWLSEKQLPAGESSPVHPGPVMRLCASPASGGKSLRTAPRRYPAPSEFRCRDKRFAYSTRCNLTQQPTAYLGSLPTRSPRSLTRASFLTRACLPSAASGRHS